MSDIMSKASATTVGWLIILACGGRLAAADQRPTRAEIRSAVNRAWPLLQKGAIGHREQRSCFSCHNNGLPVLALATARPRGFEAISKDELEKQRAFTANFLAKNRESYLKGQGQGGQVTTAGYALLTLEVSGGKPDAVTAAVAEYLLLFDKKLDHWRSNCSRPPSEASAFTSSYLALRALRTFGTPEQKERIAARIAQVREWLLKTPAKDTEDRVFRLWGLTAAGADKEAVRSARNELLRTQRSDGGWSQTDALDSDAYATGSALVVLHEAGLAVSDPVYRRGLKFLIRSQLGDGSWHVKSRSKPFQKYYESGYPHRNDQFISSHAAGWATMALALACGVERGGRGK